MGELFLYGIYIAIISVVYRKILAYEPILNWWFMFGSRFDGRFFYRPIWECEKCFAGQIAFWTFAINWILSLNFIGKREISAFLFKIIPQYHTNNFSVFLGLIFVCFTILTTFSLSKLYKWVEEK